MRISTRDSWPAAFERRTNDHDGPANRKLIARQHGHRPVHSSHEDSSSSADDSSDSDSSGPSTGHKHAAYDDSSSSSSGSAVSAGSDSSDSSAPIPLATNQTITLKHLSDAGSLSYTLDVTIAGQTLPVQIDTSSSDLWLASKTCKSEPCQGGASGGVTLFDSGTGTTTMGAPANLTYPQGAASGPVLSASSVAFGTSPNLRITNQAFVSAATVDNLQLGPGNFTGMLGLGPPAGSRVQGAMYEQSGNTNPGNDVTDYRSTGSVLPGLLHHIPTGSRYFSVGLRRLPSEGGKGDSTLTLGGVDTNFVPSVTSMKIEPVAVGPAVSTTSASDSDDTLPARVTSYLHQPRWRTYVQGISIDVGGENTSLPMSSTVGADFPLAVFSSAEPYALAPATFLNSFYGAYGYQPSSDGGYYVPCDTMLNVTLQLGYNALSVPIHPLDMALSQEDNGGSSSSYCLGGFQAIDGPKGNLNGTGLEGADVVIGAAMMRSIYSTYVCDSTNGTHPHGTSACNPQVGMYPLVSNISEAQSEFHQVRVQKKKLGPDPKPKSASGSKGLSSGIKALIGVLCAVAGIVLIMLVVLLWVRRQRKQRHVRQSAAKASSLEKGDGADTIGPAGSAGTGNATQARNLSGKAPVGAAAAAAPVALPMAGRTSSDSFHSSAESTRSNWTGNQLEHARQINLMNGVYDDEVGQPGDEDPTNGGVAGVAANFAGRATPGAAATNAVGVDSGNVDSNDPYRDAKKIKGAYLQKHPSFEGNPKGDGAFNPEASSPLDALASGPSQMEQKGSNPFASPPTSRSPTSGAESSGDSDKEGWSSNLPSLSRAYGPAAGAAGAVGAAVAAAGAALGARTGATSPAGARPARANSAASSSGQSAYESVDSVHDLAGMPAAQVIANDGKNGSSDAPVHPLSAATKREAAPASAAAPTLPTAASPRLAASPAKKPIAVGSSEKAAAAAPAPVVAPASPSSQATKTRQTTAPPRAPSSASGHSARTPIAPLSLTAPALGTVPSPLSPLRQHTPKQVESFTNPSGSTAAAQAAAAANSSILSSPQRSPAPSIRQSIHGPAAPRANMMSPPSLRPTNPASSAASLQSPPVAHEAYFDPLLLPPPLPTGTTRGGNHALAQHLSRATAGMTSPFNPSGSVSGSSTPGWASPTSSWPAPGQPMAPVHNVRMQPAFMQMQRPQAGAHNSSSDSLLY